MLKNCGLSIFQSILLPNMKYLPTTWVTIVKDGGTNNHNRKYTQSPRVIQLLALGEDRYTSMLTCLSLFF